MRGRRQTKRYERIHNTIRAQYTAKTLGKEEGRAPKSKLRGTTPIGVQVSGSTDRSKEWVDHRQ